MTENEIDNQCFRTALRLLGRRDHSASELTNKLKGRGFSLSVIEPVIATCRRLNYIDDQKFSENYARNLKNKGFGALRVAQMLRAKGVSKELIVAAQADQTSFDQQCAQCRRALTKKRKTMTSLKDPAKRKAGIYRFLMNRGFGADVIHQVMNEAFSQAAGETTE
jgi:regulatory protein